MISAGREDERLSVSPPRGLRHLGHFLRTPEFSGMSDPLAVVWSMDGADFDCDCPGPPPPAFRLPPPPRPPYLHDLPDCSEAPILDLETCNAMPVIDAEYHSSPALPSLAVIVVCSVLLLAILLLATALVWKHKKKMQNFLPCKSSPQNHCDLTHGNGVIYEDLTNIRPRPLPQPSMEMLDVKARGVEMPYHSPVFICPPPSHNRPIAGHQYCSQDLYNPVYEELSNGSGERGDSEGESECGPQGAVSEDEFAEDELSLGGGERGTAHHSGTSSLQGSTGNDLCRDIDSSDPDDRFLGLRNLSLPPGGRIRGQEPGERQPRSLRRIRHKGEFHEGLLLDALLRPPPHRLPYILPVPPAHYESVLHYPSRHPEFTTFRPSQDSDSGYSHNTSGGRGSSRGRKDSHRIPHSADLVLS